jgi:Salmonella virulence plasmid 65kDa B protein/FG-GAP-like repeat
VKTNKQLQPIQEIKPGMSLRGMRIWLFALAAVSTLSPVHANEVIVGDGGTASYSVPIAVPPGRAGMEPKLSIVYNSSGINGPVGVGWAVQGISQVTRCAAINQQDGRRVVRYEANDVLCLDGQRLIISTPATAGNPGAPASSQLNSAGPANTEREYRTENDGFSRILAKGDVAGAPAVFKVWSKAGLITEYGAVDAVPYAATSDARVSTVGHLDDSRNGRTAAWLVKRISDTTGNFIEFDYVQESVLHGSGPNGVATPGKEWRLTKVRYTGHVSDPSTANEVELVYNGAVTIPDPLEGGFDSYPRPDFYESYHAGFKFAQTRILRSVVVRNAGNIVRQYRLRYAASETSKRALLSSISECSAAGLCLRPVAFNYNVSSGGWMINHVVRGVLASDLSGTGLGVLTGDFNGDGRTDLLRWSTDPTQNRLYLASASVAGHFAQLTTGFNLTGVNDKLGGNDNIKTYVMDINGDAIPDLVRVCKTTSDCPGVSMWLARGDGSFKQLAVTGLSSVWNSPMEVMQCSQISMAFNGKLENGTWSSFKDFDGDGRLDVLRVNRTKITPTCPMPAQNAGSATLFKGDGRGGFVATNYSFSNFSQVPLESKSFRGTDKTDAFDINADALPDAVGNAIHINTESGFSTAFSGFAALNVVAIDVNGDGKLDILASDDMDGPSSGYTAAKATPGLYINRGDGTFALDSRGLSTAATDSNFRLGSGVIGSFPADINGDGLTDMVSWDGSGNPSVWLTRPSLNGAIALVKSTANHNLPNMHRTFFMGDFGGTGDLGLLVVDGSSVYMRSTSTGTSVDLLRQVTTTTGLVTTITYQSLTQASNSPIYNAGRTIRQDPDTYNPFTDTVEVASPNWVVSSTKQKTGTTGQTDIETAFLYHSMKAAYGRGSLGFANVTKLYPYANGDLLVTVNEYHQDPAQFQYLGLPRYTATFSGQASYDVNTYRRRVSCSAALRRVGECEVDDPGYTTVTTTTTFNPAASLSELRLLNRTDFAYCELGSGVSHGDAAVPPTPGSPYAAPCVASGLIRRPYQSQSVERKYDLASGALVTQAVSSNREMTAFGEVKRARVQITAPSVAGQTGWSSTKDTENSYDANDLSKWLLGRLTNARVASSSTAPQPTKTAGSAPRATDTSGNSTPPPPTTAVSPAVLAAILQLLLED